MKLRNIINLSLSVAIILLGCLLLNSLYITCYSTRPGPKYGDMTDQEIQEDTQMPIDLTPITP